MSQDPDISAGYQDLTRFNPDMTDGQKSDYVLFGKHWNANKVRYMAVGAVANVPGPLVAVINWREESGSFSGYLHNGDPLGKPTTDEPVGILFNDWELAAADALSIHREPRAWALSGVSARSGLTDMCVFCEAYNGLGYAKHGFPSPYVLAGTTGYSQGKFTSDGRFDENAVDAQLGVLQLLRAIAF